VGEKQGAAGALVLSLGVTEPMIAVGFVRSIFAAQALEPIAAGFVRSIFAAQALEPIAAGFVPSIRGRELAWFRRFARGGWVRSVDFALVVRSAMVRLPSCGRGLIPQGTDVERRAGCWSGAWSLYPQL